MLTACTFARHCRIPQRISPAACRSTSLLWTSAQTATRLSARWLTTPVSTLFLSSTPATPRALGVTSSLPRIRFTTKKRPPNCPNGWNSPYSPRQKITCRLTTLMPTTTLLKLTTKLISVALQATSTGPNCPHIRKRVSISATRKRLPLMLPLLRSTMKTMQPGMPLSRLSTRPSQK